MLTRVSGGGCGPFSSDPESDLSGLGGGSRFIAGTLGPETAAMDGRGRGASEPTERKGEWGKSLRISIRFPPFKGRGGDTSSMKGYPVPPPPSAGRPSQSIAVHRSAMDCDGPRWIPMDCDGRQPRSGAVTRGNSPFFAVASRFGEELGRAIATPPHAPPAAPGGGRQQDFHMRCYQHLSADPSLPTPRQRIAAHLGGDAISETPIYCS